MQPFGYTGYQMEAAGGLHFAQARRYDAESGRFVSEDKIAGNIVRPVSLHRYGYCWNNPLVLVDLNGLEPEPITAADGREAHDLLYYLLKNDVFYQEDMVIYRYLWSGENVNLRTSIEMGHVVE